MSPLSHDTQRTGRIALSMIVKNEAHVIRRCLNSVRPLIDRWLIVDTGSTDGTQDAIRSVLADIPGSLIERPWVDFAHNRNEALEAARELADYVFTLDADEELIWPENCQIPVLQADAYALWMSYENVRYRRTCLLRSHTPWRWRGVLHEHLECETPQHTIALEQPTVLVRAEGARSRNPHTYRRDAELLQHALAAEPNNTRYQFYLAQSLRDAGEPLLAYHAYEHRAAMGGWEEEVWYSIWQMARLSEALGMPPRDVSHGYLRAYLARPARAEPLVDLARWHRVRAEWPLAWLYAKQAVEIPMPNDSLFIDSSVYRWQALDEFAIAAFYVGHEILGAHVLRRLLMNDLAPESERSRLWTNVAHYQARGQLSDLVAPVPLVSCSETGSE